MTEASVESQIATELNRVRHLRESRIIALSLKTLSLEDDRVCMRDRRGNPVNWRHGGIDEKQLAADLWVALLAIIDGQINSRMREISRLALASTIPDTAEANPLARGGEGWILTEEQRPPEGLIVETKVEDQGFIRKVEPLVLKGGLWWFADGSMVAKYEPTHWRYVG